MQASVQILLATYNGEKFLRQQLDSLFQQTYSDFQVLIRDDGSTDQTLAIIQEYQAKNPGKIIFIKDENKNVGATQNFGILMQHANADYIFFCDQDDVWLPQKIELSLQTIKKLEEDTTIPCMVYSDMKLMDENGNITQNSTWKQLKLHPKFFTLNRLLVQNIPHGCAIAINKKMLALARPLPKQAILHDHWIALLAASIGKHKAIETPLVLLRNHAQNVTRKQKNAGGFLKRIFKNSISKQAYEHFIDIRVAQAEALKERLLSQNFSSQIIDDFIALKNSSSWQRKNLILKNKFFRTTLWHTFKMFMRS
ncbi:MAG: glycosyltransferase family 2 protein [Bacteroidetes bacterium]|nr:glycosyltransferase family 2 protein [Bacteroidota bacterium]